MEPVHPGPVAIPRAVADPGGGGSLGSNEPRFLLIHSTDRFFG